MDSRAPEARSGVCPQLEDLFEPTIVTLLKVPLVRSEHLPNCGVFAEFVLP
jgi:hypothetical protein